MRFRDRIRRFMAGRYGGDSLNTALSLFYFICFVTALIVMGSARNTPAGMILGCVLYFISLAVIALIVFRTFSRNLPARRAEFEWYRSHVLAPIARRRNERRTRKAQRATHRFFKCPGCRQTVRVPRGKGRIRITCPKCGKVFEKKT